MFTLVNVIFDEIIGMSQDSTQYNRLHYNLLSKIKPNCLPILSVCVCVQYLIINQKVMFLMNN